MFIPSIGRGVASLKQKMVHSPGLPFQKMLPESTIDASVEAENVFYRKRIFSPAVTVWTFLSQMLDKDKTCKNAVSRIIADRAAKGEPIPSADASAYSQARQRLPENAIQSLALQTAQDLEGRVPQQGLWKGRHVQVIDGSTVLMADTPQNQAAYPQHGNQKEGCGFPIARIVGLFSLITGALSNLLIGDWKTHELTLARQLYPTLAPDTVVLGDAIFGSYADFWMLGQYGLDALFQIYGARKTDFRKGKRLGKEDHLATWTKPKQRPKGLPQEIYDQLPQTLTVRELKWVIKRKGFKTRKITLVTTLLDPVEYPKEELGHLFGLRWQVELNLRHLKTTMTMEFLNAKTPQMVRKEIFAHLLAYNLIRSLMWEAGMRHGVDPIRLSFQASIQHLLNFIPKLVQAGRNKRRELTDVLLGLIAGEKLPDRSGRYEPRVRKRRPKPFPLMQEPRHILRKKLIA